NDYFGSDVHKMLYVHISKHGIEQTVFSPLRLTTIDRYRKLKDNDLNYMVVGSDPLNVFHKFIFEHKSKFLMDCIISKVPRDGVTCVHATTLFSDGVLAYNLQKKEGIPYIVTVRSTDVTTFFRFRPDLLSLGRRILLSAKAIVFVSDSVKKRLFSKRLFKDIRTEVERKAMVSPNGIDGIWIDNVATSPKRRVREGTWRVLYVGTFLKRKNLDKLIIATRLLRQKGCDLE